MSEGEEEGALEESEGEDDEVRKSPGDEEVPAADVKSDGDEDLILESMNVPGAGTG